MGGGTTTGGVLTLTNFNRVAALLDEEAATLLDSHGLIRHDGWFAAKPEVWKLRVRLGSATPISVRGLRHEINQIVYTALSLNYGARWGQTKRTHFECLYYREAAGKSQVTLASRAGLIATLTPCVVIPVEHYG